MSQLSPRDEILAILSEISKTPVADLRPDMDLVADLGIDSPKALRLVVEIEERLDLEISDEDAAKLTTVGEVLAHLGDESD
jgi:acyl carrier protein